MGKVVVGATDISRSLVGTKEIKTVFDSSYCTIESQVGFLPKRGLFVEKNQARKNEVVELGAIPPALLIMIDDGLWHDQNRKSSPSGPEGIIGVFVIEKELLV
jgi:hypothetical protein